jgi:hypothetical protein
MTVELSKPRHISVRIGSLRDQGLKLRSSECETEVLASEVWCSVSMCYRYSRVPVLLRSSCWIGLCEPNVLKQALLPSIFTSWQLSYMINISFRNSWSYVWASCEVHLPQDSIKGVEPHKPLNLNQQATQFAQLKAAHELKDPPPPPQVLQWFSARVVGKKVEETLRNEGVNNHTACYSDHCAGESIRTVRTVS